MFSEYDQDKLESTGHALALVYIAVRDNDGAPMSALGAVHGGFAISQMIEKMRRRHLFKIFRGLCLKVLLKRTPRIAARAMFRQRDEAKLAEKEIRKHMVQKINEHDTGKGKGHA